MPDLLTAPTAELTVGLAITLGRSILPGDHSVRSGSYRGWRPEFYGTGLDGSAVGIIGMGAVGQAIAHRLRPFRCHISYYDQRRLTPSSEDQLGIVHWNLDTLIAQSDYIVLAAPLTPTTHHLINSARIAMMKPGALLINPARGSVVDESAVADALESGHLGGYAADAYECEDWALSGRPQSIDIRLLNSPRTVLTPHIGSAVTRVRRDIELTAAQELSRFFSGQPLQCQALSAHDNPSR